VAVNGKRGGRKEKKSHFFNTGLLVKNAVQEGLRAPGEGKKKKKCQTAGKKEGEHEVFRKAFHGPKKDRSKKRFHLLKGPGGRGEKRNTNRKVRGKKRGGKGREISRKIKGAAQSTKKSRDVITVPGLKKGRAAPFKKKGK